MAVISDEASTTDEPMVVSLSDYYPYGMTEPGRSYSESDDYRYGYTGHEKENDLAEGVYTTEYRLLDTRLGRWMSVDPLFAKYPGMSSYNYCGGNPIALVDVDGRDMNGGITFVNNSSKTIYLGGASGLNEDGKQIDFENTYIELTPGARLEPCKINGQWMAKLTTIVRDENAMEVKNDNGTIKTEEQYIYAYDVDYIQLQKDQTLVLKNGLRFNTNIFDSDAETPVSTWTEVEYNKNPDCLDHTKFGDLKVCPAGLRKIFDGFTSVITFENGEKEGEIKCDVDGGWIESEGKKVNIASPSIFPEKHSLPHVDGVTY